MPGHTATTTTESAVRAHFRAAPHAVANEIDVTGSACLPSMITPQWLEHARVYAARLAAAGDHEIMIEGLDQGGPEFIGDLASDAQLQYFLEAVAVQAFPSGHPADRRVDCTIRVINGADPEDKPLWFHYDATVLTMVIPVVIPDSGPGRSGELAIIPNRRPYRRWVTWNVIEKFVVQSDVYRRWFVGRLRLGDVKVVTLRPGNAYLFAGYRSYHATMPCPTGSTRVTVIIHYKEVHRGSRVLQSAKALYQRFKKP
jgi:hypothetical protein